MLKCPEILSLSIHGCINAIVTDAGTKESFDWKNALADASVIGGMAVFTSLAGALAAGIPLETAVVSAAVSAGGQFFGLLALKRQLIKRE